MIINGKIRFGDFMARMHTRKKGQSSSMKPYRTDSPEWIEYSKKEIEEMIVSIAKEDGVPSASIGLTLRDQYGIPSIKDTTGKKIGTILKDNGIVTAIPDDLLSLMKKAVRLDMHLKQNRHDTHNKRSAKLIDAKIRRLVKYYIRTGKLEKGWKYSLKKAELLIR